VALAAIEGRVTLEHFTEEWTSHPDISKLAAKVTVVGSDELDAHFPEQKGAIVTVRTPSGEHTERVAAPRGSPGQPLTEAELQDKFGHLAGAVLDADAVSLLWEGLVAGEPTQRWTDLSDVLARSRA
jgi:2-methylcitrate dehydratase